MWRKFLSRRFLLAAGTVAAVVTGENLPVETIATMGATAGAFILGESAVDHQREKRKAETMREERARKAEEFSR